MEISQGDILKIDSIKYPVLVTSKNYFNKSGEIVGCPIIENLTAGPLHIYVESKLLKGIVKCEDMRLIDLTVRRYSMIDRLPMSVVIDITDAIQSIFDYVF